MTATLTEATTAAAATGDHPIIAARKEAARRTEEGTLGSSFDLLPGFTPVPSPPTPNALRFALFVTEVRSPAGQPAMLASALDVASARLLGQIINAHQLSPGLVSRLQYGPSTKLGSDIPTPQVALAGSTVRHGIPYGLDGALVAVDGHVLRLQDNTFTVIASRSAESIGTVWVPLLCNWMLVTQDSDEAQPGTGLWAIPSGWELVPTPPAEEVRVNTERYFPMLGEDGVLRDPCRYSPLDAGAWFDVKGSTYLTGAAVVGRHVENGSYVMTEDGTIYENCSGGDLERRGNVRNIGTGAMSAIDTLRWVEVRRSTSAAPALPAVDLYTGDSTAVLKWAVRREDGSIALKPEFEEGKHYLCWVGVGGSTAFITCMLGVFTELDGQRGLLRTAEVHQSGGLGEWSPRASAFTTAAYLNEAAYEWVQAEPIGLYVPPAADDDDRGVTASELDVLMGRRSYYNTKLNELAKENEWCGEYEEVIIPLGFEGREDEKASDDVSVTVRASFEAVMSSPNTHIDSGVADAVGLNSSLSMDTLTMEGTVMVTVTVEDVLYDPDEGVERSDFIDRLTDSMIEEAIADELDDSSDIEVSDWEVTDYSVG